MIRDDAVKLSEAPGSFLGDDWATLVALKGDKNRALDSLDHPDPSMIAFYRQENLRLNLGSPESRKQALFEEEVAALTSKMIAELRGLGANGRIEASGLYVGTGLRQAIPAELWPSAKLGFAAQSFNSGEFAYRNVTVAPAIVDVEDAIATIRTWLEKRRDERGEESKKELRWAAQKEFGEAFTVRAFNEAYRAIYGRARGRPQKRI